MNRRRTTQQRQPRRALTHANENAADLQDAGPYGQGGEAAAAPRTSPPIELVDVAEIPGGGQLQLLRCGDDFSIQFGEDELMGSRSHMSEQALATLTCERLASNDGHVLIGGLGMGFTLGAVLAAWAPGSSIVVAELVPQIIDWAKGHLAHLFGTNLSDPRVSIRLADVHDVIISERNRYDAILLDVDNGPDGFMTPANDRLYCNWGLKAAFAALRPNGVLAVWSAYSDADFAERLEAAGFTVDETILPAFADSRDDWHNIWFGSKPGLEAAAM